MNKYFTRFVFLFFSFLFIATSSHAQSEMDAANLSQRELSGTARMRSMAGAFAALGGDVSSVERNPAGVAVSRSGDFNITFNLNGSNTSSLWQNNSLNEKKFNSGVCQFGFIKSFFLPSEGQGINVGVSYTKPFSTNRIVNTHLNRPTPYSLADFVAYNTPIDVTTVDMTFDGSYDPYNAGIPWFSVLGYQSGWIVPVQGERGPYETSFLYDDNGTPKAFGPSSSYLSLHERTSYSENAISLGYNYMDKLYIGTSFNISSFDFSVSSLYEEQFIDGDYLDLQNTLSTTGHGFSYSLGLIARPMDILRLGVAFHSGTYFVLRDIFSAQASSRYSKGTDKDGNLLPPSEWVYKGATPENAFARYRMKTPPRFVLGLASILGSKGLLSIDYEISPYTAMSIYDSQKNPYVLENKAIDNHFSTKSTIRIGGEFRIIPSLALRAGFIYSSVPMKSGNGLSSFEGTSQKEVLVAGTIPHYFVPGAYNAETCGIGYHITSSVYVDAAFTYATRRQHLYTFPSVIDSKGEIKVKSADAATIKHNEMSLFLTFGIRM